MKVTDIGLSILLVGTKLFWAHQVVDTGVTVSCRDQHNWESEETRKQLMAMLPELATPKKKIEVVRIAEGFTNDETFEKEGCTWVGWLGLKFDDEENLISV